MADFCPSCGNYRLGYAQLENACQQCGGRVICRCGCGINKDGTCGACGAHYELTKVAPSQGVTMKPSLSVRPRALSPKARWTREEKEDLTSYVERLEAYARGLETQVQMFLFQRDTGVDPLEPPHEVPCPLCLAYALEPCRDQPRPGTVLAWPQGSRMVTPHAERQKHWERRPEIRVKAIKEKLW